jgi:hypothetical protein
MNLQEINKVWEKLPPAGSLKLYAILNAEELAEFRSHFDQQMAECVYKAQAQ